MQTSGRAGRRVDHCLLSGGITPADAVAGLSGAFASAFIRAERQWSPFPQGRELRSSR
jgi:hypothetical protein